MCTWVRASQNTLRRHGGFSTAPAGRILLRIAWWRRKRYVTRIVDTRSHAQTLASLGEELLRRVLGDDGYADWKRVTPVMGTTDSAGMSR